MQCVSHGISGTGLGHKLRSIWSLNLWGALRSVRESSEAGTTDFMNAAPGGGEGSFTPNRVYGRDTQPPSTRAWPVHRHVPVPTPLAPPAASLQSTEHGARPRERPAGSQDPPTSLLPGSGSQFRGTPCAGQPNNTRGVSPEINRPTLGRGLNRNHKNNRCKLLTHTRALRTGRSRLTPVSADCGTTSAHPVLRTRNRLQTSNETVLLTDSRESGTPCAGEPAASESQLRAGPR